MNPNEDTDTLLALVSSLLNNPAPDPGVLLDALVQCNGDVERAARSINAKLEGKEPDKKQGKKRKRLVDLDEWLKPTASMSTPARKRIDKVGANEASSSTLPLAAPPVSPHKSPSKPSVNLMTILRQPPAAHKTIPRLPPLMLATPFLVAEHTPCTLHLSVLPPELACRLFYTMIDASKGWKRNKWWLFDRVVESPHLTSFYARKDDGVDGNESWQEAAQFWYNGRMTDPPTVFPPAMEEACHIIERIVNAEMRKRKRFPLEWGDDSSEDLLWRANVAASNRYEGGKESVGFHTDHLTYLGPYPTIASLSLGTRRVFSLREVIPSDEAETRRAQTFNIPLPHNSLTIMHASAQERFKHSIPPQSTIDAFRPAYPTSSDSPIEPSNCRINITFRFYRPDFRPPSIPRCKCGIPTILRPDMKGSGGREREKYWWCCYAGAQNEGKGCGYWKVMDMEAEGRGSGRKGEYGDKVRVVDRGADAGKENVL